MHRAETKAGFLARLFGASAVAAPPTALPLSAASGLVFHLGDFKTGSTAIQSWLAAHGGESGINTPPGFNQAALAQSLTGPAAEADAAFGALATYLRRAPARCHVISAEHFELVDPARLAALIARHLPDWVDADGAGADGLRLIAYVRPHPAAYLARFAESTKIGSHDGDLDRYLDRPDIPRRMSYAPRFGAWRAVFGPRFTLRLYDRATLAGGDVARDFLHFVTGRDPGPLAQPAPTNPTGTNPTPGLQDLALLRAFHRAIGSVPDMAEGARWTLGRHLGRQLDAVRAATGQPATDTALRLHASLAARLADRFGADAAATDAAFFAAHPGGPPLTAALAQAQAAALPVAQSLEPDDHFSAQTLAIVALWGDMLRTGLLAPDGAALLDRLYHEY